MHVLGKPLYYQNYGQENAHEIAKLSYRDFLEMSKKTAGSNFLLQKKIKPAFCLLISREMNTSQCIQE